MQRCVRARAPRVVAPRAAPPARAKIFSFSRRRLRFMRAAAKPEKNKAARYVATVRALPEREEEYRPRVYCATKEAMLLLSQSHTE